MYPSFYGMQPHVYEAEEEPNFAERVVDKILLGASHYKLKLKVQANFILSCKKGEEPAVK